MTKSHLDELWGRIEQLSERLVDTPECRSTAMLLSACLDNYNAKRKLMHNEMLKDVKNLDNL